MRQGDLRVGAEYIYTDFPYQYRIVCTKRGGILSGATFKFLEGMNSISIQSLKNKSTLSFRMDSVTIMRLKRIVKNKAFTKDNHG